MEAEPLRQVEQLALKKLKVFKQSIIISLSRSMLASMFIGFGVIVAFKTGSYFYIEHSPLAYPIAALTFGTAIILISYGGGDLFTGNTFYYSYAALRKKMRWTDTIKLWITSYSGNVLGAAAFAFLIWSTGLFDSDYVNGFLLEVADKKVNTPVMQLFFRAILCNWLVCLAFFIPMWMKTDGAKMFAMMLFVFCFFISGYEHSIANMCTFAIAMVVQDGTIVSLEGAIRNLIPVTLGNLIGGSVLMGWMYYFVNKPFLNDGENKA
ncbi:formate/nitrite transporter family protein [Paenibacillus sp. J5C_2022]|uniref:formate/nitrite transporter family protein n=1 Tax=Paenibacillus sp. J5C2022 TaxID=2977129 RepID=UPI0021D13D21|nr:formate/nitrite transporter family protein [Paenibacillus sp. J5C2022]MCU6712386.1 formate/nitrite transporter family protein [Paenibacillus sp. J5C2022]